MTVYLFVMIAVDRVMIKKRGWTAGGGLAFTPWRA
jgi:hypothetical protein